MKAINDRERDLLEAYCQGSISESEFKEFEACLRDNPELRAETRHYLALDSFLREKTEANSDFNFLWQESESKAPVPVRRFQLLPIAIAAVISFAIGSALIYALNNNQPDPVEVVNMPVKSNTAKGFAVIEKIVDVEWADGSTVFKSGDSIGKETLHLTKGIVHIEFFCGASVILEGPAELKIDSAWEAFCKSGRLHAQVPPAAHGFTINTTETKVVDLGTEFGLTVNDNGAEIVVFDGEVELNTSGQNKTILTEGKGIRVQNHQEKVVEAYDAASFINRSHLAREAALKQKAYAEWLLKSQEWSNDERLIAYYTLDDQRVPFVQNKATKNSDNLIGKIILAERVSSRWGDIEHNGAMEFKKPGSRVRVNIPGEFKAISLSCWVRIDSLDHNWNGLFMCDSYQPGEFHWQLNHEGKLVFCSKRYDQPKKYHQLNYSEVLWEPSMAGQWMHLATVYNPETKHVTFYKNGELVSRVKQSDDFLVKTFRIGAAEIGNWGLPTRTLESFAIRNLNGRIDELMIHKVALNDSEIKKIYQQSASNK